MELIKISNKTFDWLKKQSKPVQVKTYDTKHRFTLHSFIQFVNEENNKALFRRYRLDHVYFDRDREKKQDFVYLELTPVEISKERMSIDYVKPTYRKQDA